MCLESYCTRICYHWQQFTSLNEAIYGSFACWNTVIRVPQEANVLTIMKTLIYFPPTFQYRCLTFSHCSACFSNSSVPLNGNDMFIMYIHVVCRLRSFFSLLLVWPSLCLPPLLHLLILIFFPNTNSIWDCSGWRAGDTRNNDRSSGGNRARTRWLTRLCFFEYTESIQCTYHLLKF